MRVPAVWFPGAERLEHHSGLKQNQLSCHYEMVGNPKSVCEVRVPNQFFRAVFRVRFCGALIAIVALGTLISCAHEQPSAAPGRQAHDTSATASKSSRPAPSPASPRQQAPSASTTASSSSLPAPESPIRSISRPLSAPVPKNGKINLSADAFVSDELKRLPLGQIAFDPPTTMKRGATARVEVRIAKAQLPQIEAGMAGTIEKQLIQVSTVMSVDMKGTAFQVVALDPPSQVVSDTGFTQWAFNITPTARGDQTLSLAASVEIRVPGMGSEPHAFPVLNRTIHVDVDPVGFLEDNWQWFAGTIVVPLLILLWRSFRQKPQEGRSAAA